MSTIRKTVYKIWANSSLRFGNIIDEKMDGNWLYVNIKWQDDQAHQKDIARVLELRNIEYDTKYDWHRIDSVQVFDAYKMTATLEKLKSGTSF